VVRRGEEASGNVDCWGPTVLRHPPPARGGGCWVHGRCQGAAPLRGRIGLHSVVVSSELEVVSSELGGG
jgi:hypothetical protein